MRTTHPVPITYTIKPMDDLEPTGWAWWIEEALDQAAHLVIALAVIALAALMGAAFTPLAGMFTGMALGVTREVTEGGNVLSDGSMTDMGFWALGGLLGALLI